MGIKTGFLCCCLIFFSFVVSLGQTDSLKSVVPDSTATQPTDSILPIKKPQKKRNRIVLPDAPKVNVPIQSDSAQAQNPDTAIVSPVLISRDSLQKPSLFRAGGRPPYDPKIAWKRSALIPGWGQIYNRSAWKVPIFYAGYGALIGISISENKEYKDLRTAYIARTDDDPATIDTMFSSFITDNSIRSARDSHRRNRDLMFIIMAVWHGLNIVEAYVDAHLKGFDVSEDLTLRAYPTIKSVGFANNPPVLTTGATISLTFK